MCAFVIKISRATVFLNHSPTKTPEGYLAEIGTKKRRKGFRNRRALRRHEEAPITNKFNVTPGNQTSAALVTRPNQACLSSYASEQFCSPTLYVLGPKIQSTDMRQYKFAITRLRKGWGEHTLRSVLDLKRLLHPLARSGLVTSCRLNAIHRIDTATTQPLRVLEIQPFDRALSIVAGA